MYVLPQEMSIVFKILDYIGINVFIIFFDYSDT